MLDILIIGAGSIGERHIRCFLKTNLARVSVCDVDKSTLDRIKSTYSLSKTYADFNEAISEKPTAVIIATPAHLHIPIAIEAAKSGCHLLIEKPISTNPEGIETLQSLVSEKNLIAIVGYTLRHYPFVYNIKKRLETGDWGEPLHLNLYSGQHFPLYRPAYNKIYYNSHETGGGAIQDGLTHFLDMAQWWLGPITNLTADFEHVSLKGVVVEDTVSILARHGKIMAAYHLNQHQFPNESVITMVCEKATVRLNLFDNQLRIMDSPDGNWQNEKEVSFDRDDAFIAQASEFINLIKGYSSDIPCSIEDAKHTLNCQMSILSDGKESIKWKKIKMKSNLAYA